MRMLFGSVATIAAQASAAACQFTCLARLSWSGVTKGPAKAIWRSQSFCGVVGGFSAAGGGAVIATCASARGGLPGRSPGASALAVATGGGFGAVALGAGRLGAARLGVGDCTGAATTGCGAPAR